MRFLDLSTYVININDMINKDFKNIVWWPLAFVCYFGKLIVEKIWAELSWYNLCFYVHKSRKRTTVKVFHQHKGPDHVQDKCIAAESEL